MEWGGQAELEKLLDHRLEGRLAVVLGHGTAAAAAFDALCDLPPNRPLRQPPADTAARRARRQRSHRREVSCRVLALYEALELKAPRKGRDRKRLRALAGAKESRRLGISRKARLGLPGRLTSIGEGAGKKRRDALAAEVSAVVFAPGSPVQALLERAFRASQVTDPRGQTEAFALCRRAEALLDLPDMVRAGGGDELAAALEVDERDQVPTLATAQKVRLLAYLRSWAGQPHYRQVARVVLHLESRPTAPLETEEASLKRLARRNRLKLAVPLHPSF